jgi:hypothetical protein
LDPEVVRLDPEVLRLAPGGNVYLCFRSFKEEFDSAVTLLQKVIIILSSIIQNHEKMSRSQGDQIGRIFAHWASVYFG